MSDKIDWYPTKEYALHHSRPPVGHDEKDIVIHAKTIAEAVSKVLLTPLGFIRPFRVLRISSPEATAPEESFLEVVIRVYPEASEGNPVRALPLTEVPLDAECLFDEAA